MRQLEKYSYLEEKMDYFEESSGKLKKAGIASICIVLALLAMINSC